MLNSFHDSIDISDANIDNKLIPNQKKKKNVSILKIL